MLRNPALNLVTILAVLAILGVAFALSPIGKAPPPELAETKAPGLEPPPDWPDPSVYAVARLVLTDPAASSLRFTSGTTILRDGEYSIYEQNLTVSFPHTTARADPYVAMMEVVRNGERELHIFSGLDGLWAWIGNDEGLDTSGRPAPFRIHVTPEIIRYQVWAKDCPSRVPSDPPEIVNEGFITYGASRGMTQTVAFLGESEACGAYEISLSSLGGFRTAVS